MMKIQLHNIVYKILIVWEKDFKQNKKEVLDKVFNFINNENTNSAGKN